MWLINSDRDTVYSVNTEEVILYLFKYLMEKNF
jgi:hypothetical protein